MKVSELLEQLKTIPGDFDVVFQRQVGEECWMCMTTDGWVVKHSEVQKLVTLGKPEGEIEEEFC